MTFRWGKIRLHVHPLLPLLWAVACVTGMHRHILPVLLAFFLHECGHLLMARLFLIPVAEIEVTPLGGVISLQNAEASPAVHHFFLALAGPACSFLGCLLTALLYRGGIISFFFACAFAKANLILFLFNLLPVLPLDGGQMIRVLLCRLIPCQTATRVLTQAALIIGLTLCCLTFYFAFQGIMLLSPVFSGLYLIYAANLEGKQSTARYVTDLIARRQRLEKHETLPVEAFAAGADMPVRSLLQYFRPGKYHFVLVLSPDGMERKGYLEEKALCDAILSAQNPTLGTLIEK